MITQSEYMRRMKEMANIQAGMNFYGEMPNMYNIVLNSNHQLINTILSDEEKECATSISSIQQEIEEIEKRRADIKESHKTKKEEEIPVADKELLDNFSKQEETLKANKESIYASYASQNKIVKQLIDLALLQNGMLKGEALNNFVKRSIELIK